MSSPRKTYSVSCVMDDDDANDGATVVTKLLLKQAMQKSNSHDR